MFGNHFLFALTQDHCFYENTIGHQVFVCSEADRIDGQFRPVVENLSSGRTYFNVFQNVIYSFFAFCFLEMGVLIKLMIIGESLNAKLRFPLSSPIF